MNNIFNKHHQQQCSIVHKSTTTTWNDCPNIVSLWSNANSWMMNDSYNPPGGTKSDRDGWRWSSDFLPEPRSRSAQPMLRWFHVVHSGKNNMINFLIFALILFVFPGHMWYYLCDIHMVVNTVCWICSDFRHTITMSVSYFSVCQHGDISNLCLPCDGFSSAHNVHWSSMFT